MATGVLFNACRGLFRHSQGKKTLLFWTLVRDLRTWKTPGKQRYAQELWPQRLTLADPGRDHGYVPTLSPQQISSVLDIHESEFMVPVPGKYNTIQGFDSNQLASNTPIEDRRAVCHLQQTNGSLFGVYDGHAGAACGQAISERLFEYIAIALLHQEQLAHYSHTMRTNSPMDLVSPYMFENHYSNQEMYAIYRNSLQKFVVETLTMSDLDDASGQVADAMKTAFTQLDRDICTEAIPVGSHTDDDTLAVALSGACACVAHVDGVHLHVANTGDTRAVLGQLQEDGSWKAIPLSTDHNAENKAEVERLQMSHPQSEHNFLLRNGRLLGQLIPLRAFGDIRYKWELSKLKQVLSGIDSNYVIKTIPSNYHTPPYLTAEPEVTYHRLSKRDRFLVLGTDGLWETLSNEEVVNLVASHHEGEMTEAKFALPHEGISLGTLNTILHQRRSGLARKTLDSNAATYLLRSALGGDHIKVSEMLTLPADVVRYYRDDITITIVYFDSDEIAKYE